MTEQAERTRRGRPPVTEHDRRRQRLAISRHAVALFRERGVAATSGADIASAAGVSERTVWRLFRTKESCVEPLLTEALDGFREVLRSWPEKVELTEHLRSAYRFLPEEADTDDVLAIVRLSRDTPGLRAVWLVLHEQAEPTIAEVLSPRIGLDPDTAEARLLAATVNAAFRVVTDDVARAAGSGATVEALDEHRRRLAEVLRIATGVAPPPR